MSEEAIITVSKDGTILKVKCSSPNAKYLKAALEDRECYALVMIVGALKALPESARTSALNLANELCEARRIGQ